MPTLQFKGKNVIWNHHLSVPYHALESIPSLAFRPEEANGNLIVEGDNLLALKALLPHHTGAIKCIYIDPPYNIGNDSDKEAGWIYNDNVNSPLIREWLGKEVGKDDLTRHDKWLCMMTPRLKLLFELLSDDGAIFISIDDTELAHLRLLMDAIFGEENFVATIPWRKRTAKSDVPFGVSQDFEWILCYSKGGFNAGLAVERTYHHTPDYPNDGWRLADLTTQRTAKERKNAAFDMVDPKTKKVYPYNPKRVWGVTKDTFQSYYDKGKIVFPGDYEFLDISIPAYRVFESEDKAKALKKYGTEEAMRSVSTLLPKDVGMTEDGNKELAELFGEKVFRFPKPTSLIKYLLTVMNTEDCIVLDSFAGSGTTAQAVLALNEEDGGNRRFILVQMTEATSADAKKNVCRDITRERVQRAIKNFDYAGGFEYARIGQAMDAENLLAGALPAVEPFAQYIYYLSTGRNTTRPVTEIASNLYKIGADEGYSVYIIYSQDYDQLTHLALNLDLAEKIVAQDHARCVVYAPACFLDEDYLTLHRMEFVNMPYGLFERKGLEA